MPRVNLGEVMRAGGNGVVVASKCEGFKEGDRVTGIVGCTFPLISAICSDGAFLFIPVLLLLLTLCCRLLFVFGGQSKSIFKDLLLPA